LIQNKTVVDSITGLNSLYEGELNSVKAIYAGRWQRLDEFAMQLIILPEGPADIANPLYEAYPAKGEVFTRYDISLLQQLYSFMRFEQSDLEINMSFELSYKNKANHLITLIEKEYDLPNN